MKRIIIILSATIMCCATVFADQLTSAQRKAKTEIFNALKKMATNVYEMDEEKISFSYNNIKYFVSINSKDYDPLYLTLTAFFNIPEDYDTDIVRKAAIEAASNMPVFVYCEDDVLLFDCEMYAKDSKPFIAVLPNMIKALDTSFQNFDYNKAKQEYMSSGKDNASIGTSAISNGVSDDRIYIYPKVASTGNDKRLYITKVTLDSQYTILDMTSYNGGEYQNCTIAKNSYLSANGTKYTLKKAEGIAYSPQYTDYPGYDSGRDVSLSFKLYFPVLPPGTTSFDFSEGTYDGWRINGVQLNHGKSYSIYGEQIETDYHKWKCVSIEVQDGQTIVTKVVTPKKDKTAMFSSQEEYIEDADTGRKYYLMVSSIGFEGSPLISYDSNPITFYEVYPALPSNVKRINIWSGSQYYAKNIEIR